MTAYGEVIRSLASGTRPIIKPEEISRKKSKCVICRRVMMHLATTLESESNSIQFEQAATMTWQCSPLQPSAQVLLREYQYCQVRSGSTGTFQANLKVHLGSRRSVMYAFNGLQRNSWLRLVPFCALSNDRAQPTTYGSRAVRK
jgi:hypothetical protein